ncbi:putative Nucleic acid-binding, OB-fold, Nucleic acid-binding, OB-fold-like protein [Pseudoloma neurophilia]|uniref:Putative Nucleic acid-binding, OB-fold, Nucleic acid-binding, OB-fold-like protein n=1 Tax=Pseudoloma neurophilia TaxID=146866 RepID=A0A0R0M4V9_9MICR|nr:putative Nucleic acid-binding, OB-fold, Nucleic acid-binding, OB-fold-like protein [Pseudoloma neurophilia]
MRFKKISEIESNNYSTVICVVHTVLEPLKTKGTDFVTTLEVSDEDKNQISIKMFTKTPRFANFFKEHDIVKIQKVKLSKPGVGITGHGSEVEVLANLNEENSKVFVTESEMEKIKCLKEASAFIKKNQLTKVCDIAPNTTFSFIGLLLDIKEECSNLAILTMVDFTKSEMIFPIIQNAAFTNNMTLIIKVWGETQANEVKNLQIDQIYKIQTLKIGKIEHILEARISESAYTPFQKIEVADPEHQEIIEKQKQFFREAQPAKTADDFLPEEFKKFDLVKTNQIKKNGTYRIRALAVSNFPFKPANIIICDHCRSLYSTEIKFRKTKHCLNTEDCNPYHEKIIKVHFKDSAGTLSVVLKNKLAEKYAKNIALYRSKELDCIIMRNKKFNFLTDANFID